MVELTIAGASDFNSFETEFGIVGMPYAWLSRERTYSALDGPLGDGRAKLLEARGMIHLALWGMG
jgi:TRAP-type C4-dicarboxylate transport system substrate-binding protein